MTPAPRKSFQRNPLKKVLHLMNARYLMMKRRNAIALDEEQIGLYYAVF